MKVQRPLESPPHRGLSSLAARLAAAPIKVSVGKGQIAPALPPDSLKNLFPGIQLTERTQLVRISNTTTLTDEDFAETLTILGKCTDLETTRTVVEKSLLQKSSKEEKAKLIENLGKASTVFSNTKLREFIAPLQAEITAHTGKVKVTVGTDSLETTIDEAKRMGLHITDATDLLASPATASEHISKATLERIQKLTATLPGTFTPTDDDILVDIFTFAHEHNQPTNSVMTNLVDLTGAQIANRLIATPGLKLTKDNVQPLLKIITETTAIKPKDKSSFVFQILTHLPTDLTANTLTGDFATLTILSKRPQLLMFLLTDHFTTPPQNPRPALQLSQKDTFYLSTGELTALTTLTKSKNIPLELTIAPLQRATKAMLPEPAKMAILLPYLTTLTCQNISLSTEFCENLGTFTGANLTLNNCSLTHEHLKKLAQNPPTKLKVLDLSNNRLPSNKKNIALLTNLLTTSAATPAKKGSLHLSNPPKSFPLSNWEINRTKPAAPPPIAINHTPLPSDEILRRVETLTTTPPGKFADTDDSLLAEIFTFAHEHQNANLVDRAGAQINNRLLATPSLALKPEEVQPLLNIISKIPHAVITPENKSRLAAQILTHCPAGAQLTPENQVLVKHFTAPPPTPPILLERLLLYRLTTPKQPLTITGEELGKIPSKQVKALTELAKKNAIPLELTITGKLPDDTKLRLLLPHLDILDCHEMNESLPKTFYTKRLSSFKGTYLRLNNCHIDALQLKLLAKNLPKNLGALNLNNNDEITRTQPEFVALIQKLISRHIQLAAPPTAERPVPAPPAT